MWMRISINSCWFWYIIFMCHISWFLFAFAFMFFFVKILNAWKFIDFQWNVFSNQSCLRFWHLHNYIHKIFKLIICQIQKAMLEAKWSMYYCDNKKKKKTVLLIKANYNYNPSISKTFSIMQLETSKFLHFDN